MKFKIRAAIKEDCKEIWRLIKELAAYVNEPDEVKISHEDNNEVNIIFNRQVTSLELAVYEKMPDQVKISHEELERDGFCQNPFYECLVAEVAEENKSSEGFTVVGYALYFYTYSTWMGRSMYLEDLYVMPEFRGNGIGKSLLSSVAKVGKDKQCVRLQLSVLDWNTPAREFYAAKGALDLTDSEGWHFIRFHGQSLDNLASGAASNQ